MNEVKIYDMIEILKNLGPYHIALLYYMRQILPNDIMRLIIALYCSYYGRIVAVCNYGVIKIWDADGGEISTLKGHKGNVTCVVISNDLNRIISGSWDQTIRIWNAHNGTLIRTLTGHNYNVQCIAISKDDKRIVVSGNHNGTIRIWNANTGAIIRTMAGHNDSVSSVAIFDDLKRIVSGSSDGTIRIRDANTGAWIRTLVGHLKYSIFELSHKKINFLWVTRSVYYL
jgi:WD40 repeat protein